MRILCEVLIFQKLKPSSWKVDFLEAGTSVEVDFVEADESPEVRSFSLKPRRVIVGAGGAGKEVPTLS